MARQFTVEEANSLLPTVSAIMSDLRDQYARVTSLTDEIAEFEVRALGNGHGEDAPVFHPDQDVQKIRAEMRERLLLLQGMGIVVKDIEHGIVDFPARMFGREVYLCWRLGEDAVAHWHDVETGFAGRQLL